MPGREKPLRAPHTLILCPGQHGSGNEEEPHVGSMRHVALQRQGPQSLMSAAVVGPPPTALWVLPASSLLGAQEPLRCSASVLPPPHLWGGPGRGRDVCGVVGVQEASGPLKGMSGSGYSGLSRPICDLIIRAPSLPE